MPLKLRSWIRFLGLGTLAVSVAVMSADHVEAPGTDSDQAADIADVYFFPSPEAPTTKMVGSITFGGAPAPFARIETAFYCDPNVLYAFHIDRADAAGSFDNVADIRIFARFGRSPTGACGLQMENVPGAGGTFSGAIESVIASPTGLKAFAGLRNDPFFFDSQGLTALVASFGSGPPQSGDVLAAFGLGLRARRDSFAGRNASAIVFEMDTNVVAPLTAGVRPKVRVWATTSRLAG